MWVLPDHDFFYLNSLWLTQWEFSFIEKMSRDGHKYKFNLLTLALSLIFVISLYLFYYTSLGFLFSFVTSDLCEARSHKKLLKLLKKLKSSILNNFKTVNFYLVTAHFYSKRNIFLKIKLSRYELKKCKKLKRFWIILKR